jgi:hypothetical protein
MEKVVSSLAQFQRQFTADMKKISQHAPKANEAAIKAATKDAHRIVVTTGGRYKLHGRGGRKVPLGASQRIYGSGDATEGTVQGKPAGFWSIVERGRKSFWQVSKRTHYVSGKKAGTLVRARSTKKLGRTKTTSTYLAPLRTPYGPRYRVHVGAHGAIGHPWEAAAGLVERTSGKVAVEALRKELANSGTEFGGAIANAKD